MSHNYSAERTYEAQNDASLNDMYAKVKALRSVTVDIHDDSERQRAGLSSTSDAFDNFSHSLTNTSQRFTRTMAQGARQYRTTLYIIAAVVFLWFIYSFFF